MPKFRITSPDGKTFDVEGPEGSTAEQALAQVQAQYGGTQPDIESSATDFLKAATRFTPPALAMKANQKLGEMMDRAAYEAGGKATDVASSLGVSPEVAGGLGLAANVGVQAIPTVAGSMGARLASPALREEALKLMQSAIKPLAGQLERGQGQQAVKTALEEGISVSKGGMEKLRKLMEPIDDRITAKLQASTATSPLSDFQPAFTQASQAARYSPPSESSSISKAISDFADKFYPGGGQLPIQDVQKIKQAYYRALGPESYGTLTSGERTGMKAVARGAKESVASAVPGIADENAKLGPLLNALDVIERRVQLAPNRDVGGLVWLAHNLKTGILMLAARDPYTKSLLARGLYSGSEAIPSTAGALGGGILGNQMGQPSWQE